MGARGAEDAAIALEEAGEKNAKQMMGHRVCEVLCAVLFSPSRTTRQGRIFVCTWNALTNTIVTGSEDGTVLHWIHIYVLIVIFQR